MSGKNKSTTTTTTATKAGAGKKKLTTGDADRHVSSRRRRPRKNMPHHHQTTTITSKSNDDDGDDYETFALVDKENNDAFLSNLTVISSSAAAAAGAVNTKFVLADFIAAQTNTCQADFWKRINNRDSPGLSQVIIEASIGLSSPTNAGGFSLLLEEHTLELLQVCRKLLVQATTTSSCSEKQKESSKKDMKKIKSDSLTVAIHTFRALCRNNSIILSSSKHQESAIRLLYHAIVAASEQVFAASVVVSDDSKNNNKGDDNGKKQKDAASSTLATSTITAIHQSLAAYEALGFLLRDYTFYQKDDDHNNLLSTTVFCCIGNNDNCAASFQALFPVPVHRPRKKNTTTTIASSRSCLTLEQICAIGIQATRAIAKLLLLPCAHEAIVSTKSRQSSSSSSLPSCAAPAFLKLLVNDDNNNDSSPREGAIHLVRFTTLQWMLFQITSCISGSGMNSNLIADCSKQLISHCKQSHHLLWDAAAASIVVSSRPQDCLRLRQEALLVFLAVPASESGGGDNTAKSRTAIPLPIEMLSALHDKIFDMACSFAWKAAVTFVRETNCPCGGTGSTTDLFLSSSTNDATAAAAAAAASSSLCIFHEAVGAQLDLIAAQKRLIVLPYVEYCIHRARHLGPSKFMQQQQQQQHQQPTSFHAHCTSSFKSCLFQHLPYLCGHLSCRMFDEAEEEDGKRQQHQHQSSCNYGPTLALCLLATYLEHQLTLVCDDSPNIPVKLDNLSDEFIRGAHQIVKQFQECELIVELQHRTGAKKRGGGVDDTAAAAIRLRLFNMQPVDSLLRTIFQLLENDVWKKKSPGHTATAAVLQSLLELVAKVLVDCLGPVAFRLAYNASLEESKRLWISSVQCFTRGIAIFESLLSYHQDDDDQQQQERLLQLSHFAQRQLVEHLSGKQHIGSLPPAPMIEMAAKNFFNVGRQRQDMQLRNGNHAFVPLLSGIQLFTEVTRYASEPSETCQLSARWAFVAKNLMSQERNDAAIVSMASALAYVGAEQASRSIRADDADAAVNLFVFICSLSKDNLPTGFVEEANADSSEQNQTRGLIAKLINRFAERERSQFTPIEEKKTLPFTAGQTIECLFDDLNGARPLALSFEQYCNVPFCLSALVQVMFAKGTLPSELLLCPKVVMLQKIRLFIGILVRYALSLQLDSWGKGSAFDAAFTDYDFLVRLVASFIRKFLADGDSGSSAVTLGAFYVMASVCLVSRHPATNLDGWCCFSGTSKNDDSTDVRKFAILSGFAKKYAAKAASTLSSVSDTDSDWTLTASVMLPAASLYQLRLLHMEQKIGASFVSDLGSLYVHVQNAVELLASHKSDSTLVSISKRCFVSILSRYHDWLSLRGERLNALQIATWNRNMARSLGPTHLSHWLEATTLSQSVRETYLPRDHTRHCVQFSDQTSIAVVEVQACRLRSQLLSARAVPELDHVRASLRALLDQLYFLEPKPDPSQFDLLMPWVRSTVVSGLADAAHFFGELGAALCHYKTCLRECHIAAVALGRERRVIPGPSGISVPFWKSVPVSSAILRYRDRQVDCLMRISLVHESLGDYKKATAYAISAAQRTGVESTNSTTFPELIESIKQESCDSGRERQARRLLLSIKSRATAFDIVQNALGTDIMVKKSSSLADKSLCSADQDLEGILDNLTFDSLLNGFSSHQHTSSFYNAARSNYDLLVHQPQIERLAALLPGRIASSVLYELKLAEAKSSLSSNSVCEVGLESVVRSNCEEIIRAPAATASCRAEAFYLLGLLDLGHARESGALAAVWKGSTNLETTSATEDSFGHALDRARASFTAALSMLGPASNLSTRCALRSLALVSGPHGDRKVSADSSCILIHTSIGSGSRQHVAGALRIDDSCDSHDLRNSSAHVSVHDVFAALDTSLTSEKREIAIDDFMRQLKALTPPSWSYVACTICPTGELLVSSLSHNDDIGEIVAKTACIFPDGNEYGEFEVGAFDQIVKPLDSIIYRMDHTIKTGKNADSMEEAEKREWWNGRKTLDLELRSLLETVEQDFFASEAIRSVIDGADSKEDEAKRAARFGTSRGNLASLFDAATHETPLPELGHENATPPGTMNVAELKEELTTIGFEAKTLRKMRKSELVDLVHQERQHCHQKQNDHSNIASHEDVSIDQEKSCTILVLDENLHRFPFEGLPILERRIICRVPSLPFAIAKLAELSTLDHNSNGGAIVDGNYTSYVVDPDSNLSTTKDRLVPFLESISEKHGGSWKGVAGEVPTPSFIEESLLAANGLFLYFGHGCGKSYYSRKQIESLMHGDGLRRRRIQSAIVLMGCSSGRLESVNRRKATSTTDELPIYYDPEGTALSYLSAGAPCVVGNLWDVTDVDIDRYAMQMLGQFFDNGNKPADDELDDDDDDDHSLSTVSLAECVAKARSACRMRYLVGCAPVCYGIPVYR